MSKKFKKDQVFGTWTLFKRLGKGGNGEVWECYNKDQQKYAIKLLKKIKPIAYKRFLDEVNIIDKNSDINGILPIIDKYLPATNNCKEIPFYVMPIAMPVDLCFKNEDIIFKVNAFIQLCATLIELHKRKIYHRDIKLPNILFYESNFVIADFGLVDYPGKEDVSAKNEEIGPKWAMAPEMKRESTNANGEKADIYSFAKTLWIVLTGITKGFDGQYSVNLSLELEKMFKDYYLAPIDEIFTKCTDNNPDLRPSISWVLSKLKEFVALDKNFHNRNNKQWLAIQNKIFPLSFPQSCLWKSLNDIVNILKMLSSFDDLNHTFMPNGGGWDLEGANLSYESDCIELTFFSKNIVKPKRLMFESFGFDSKWNYFRLELDYLKPFLDLNLNIDNIFNEELALLENGDYIDSSLSDELMQPTSSITRWFKGSFVIFNKRSPYNLDPTTYDARHNKMDHIEFRKYVEKSAKLEK